MLQLTNLILGLVTAYYIVISVLDVYTTLNGKGIGKFNFFKSFICFIIVCVITVISGIRVVGVFQG